jgi:hypothetical protein
MTSFRSRRSENDDEHELNLVYNRFTGRTRTGRLRSVDEMHWLLHNAPGGPADSWIIEAKESTGWKIVGHHALSPVRFTFRDEDGLCAKTMHTFLLPEFRDKFLYPRFERNCLRVADTRFDATFSVGAGIARMRSAFGYENYGNWIQLERGFHPLHVIYRTITNLVGRHSYPARVWLSQRLASISAPPRQRTSIEFVEYTGAEAASSSFFANFWKEARLGAGMAPRRDCADLEWRFWKRPGFTGSTLTYTWPEGGHAYFIVDTLNPLLYSLADFFLAPASAALLEDLLDALFVWCAHQGALALRFLTTPRGLPVQLSEVFHDNMKPFALQRFFLSFEFTRRISPLGRMRTDGALPDWNATEFLHIG